MVDRRPAGAVKAKSLMAIRRLKTSMFGECASIARLTMDMSRFSESKEVRDGEGNVPELPLV